MRFQHAADKALVVTEAIDSSRVEERVAGINRTIEHALGLRVRRRRAVRVRQAHATKADGRDGEGADFACV